MKKQTGFTLIEILLAMVLMAFLVSMGLMLIRPMSVLNKAEMFRIERDLNKIFTAIKRFEVAHEGRVDGLVISDERSEICLEGESCVLKADLSSLLPRFLSTIPVNPSVHDEEGRSGYFVYRDDAGDIYLEAELSEGEETLVSRNGLLLEETLVPEVELAGSWYGSNLWGQMGTGGQGSMVSHSIEAGGGVLDVALADRVSAYISGGGELFTAGSNLLGDGQTFRMSYEQIAGNWREVEMGDNHALAVSSDGSLWGWGSNSYSQILPSGQSEYLVPVSIDNSRQWSGVAVLDTVSFAWDVNGELYSWGYSSRGGLGQGSQSWVTIPTRVGVATWQDLDVGDEFVIGIQSDGSLWSWGRNHMSGNLGYSSVGFSQDSPRLVAAGIWSGISAGQNHAAAIRDTGELFVWGGNFSGQLGLGDSMSRSTPTQVSGVWSDIASGDGYTLGVRSSGGVFAWGSNSDGAMTSSDQFFSSNVPWDTGLVGGSYVEASDRYSWVE